MDKFQEIKILLALIHHADANGQLDWKNPELGSALASAVTNGNIREEYLFDLNHAGTIHFEQVGEDGFEPIVVASINDRTHRYFANVIEEAETHAQTLERRLTEILTFNPERLSADIERAGKELEQVQGTIAGNEMLQPMRKHVAEIQRHFESVKAVSQRYEDVYKNILRPVQREGEAGVKATVRWAIISIVISTAISVVVSNWTAITAFLKNGPVVSTAGETKTSVPKTQSVVNLSTK